MGNIFLLLLVISIPNLRQLVLALEPCDDNTELDNLEKRYDIYKADVIGGESLLCDRYNILAGGQWFLVPGDQPMLTKKATKYSCGTQFPIWMNGTIPAVADGEVSRTLCSIGAKTVCDREIKVKNCGESGVAYFLNPTELCPQAYCFGEGEEGDAPNVTINQPKVEYEMQKTETGEDSFKEEIAFKCMFLVPNISLYYQIHWYIDGKNKYTTKAKQKEDFELTYLKKGRKMLSSLGISISCAVRARKTSKSQPGTMSSKSLEFFAGIKVLTPTVTLELGKEAKIQLQPTLPFECDFLGDKLRDCELFIEMFIPAFQTCQGQLVQKENKQHKCGTTIKRTNAQEVTEITVTWRTDTTYEEDKEMFVSLKVKANPDYPLWNFVLPPVTVQLIKSKHIYEGKSCSVRNDPHMTTFDGWAYESHKDGKYILYKNTDSNHSMEIQNEVTLCNRGRAMCTCGVAVRAGADVFEINRCKDNSPKFDYKSCSDDLLQVNKIHEHLYKIYLPTGAFVEVDIRKNLYSGKKVMNLEIYPSVKDYAKTEGICGTFNSNQTEDFLLRDGTTLPNNDYRTDRSYAFPISWRVRQDEDLFNMPIAQIEEGKWTDDVEYCACNKTNADDRPGDFECSHRTVVKCKRKEKSVPSQCKTKIRRRREARPNFSFIPNNFMFTERIHIEKRSISINMTQTEAREYCEQFMNASTAVRLCSEIPNIDVAAAIDTCALDIELTGTLDWSSATREAVRNQCMRELSANLTLQEKQDNGQPSIAAIIESIACPNECSGNGLCNNGTCICNNDYGAADCSLDYNSSPEVYGVNIAEGGLCDVEHCHDAFVTGDDFIDSENLMCKMEKISIDENGNKTKIDTIYRQAGHNSIFEIQCPIPSVREKRSSESTNAPFIVEFKISVANNGKMYSPAHSLYILDAECQDTYNVSGELRFTLRDGYCFINGYCYGNTMNVLNDDCYICDVTKSRFAWTFNEGYKGCKKDLPGANKLWIIGAVGGTLGAIAVIIVAVFVVKRYTRKKHVVGDSMASMAGTNDKPPPYK